MSMICTVRSLSDIDLLALLKSPDAIDGYLDDDGEGFGSFEEYDVDKAWHGIHFLLTGTAWEGPPPLNFLVGGGTEVGDVDVGYGPARGLRHSEVLKLAKALEPLSGSELRTRFDPARMIELEIYPTIWDRPLDEDDTIGYLINFYDGLRSFVRSAATDGRALLVYLN